LLPLLLVYWQPGMCNGVVSAGLLLFTAAGCVLLVYAVAVLLPPPLHEAVLLALQAAQPGRGIIKVLQQQGGIE
jgi:hypothetical protein